MRFFAFHLVSHIFFWVRAAFGFAKKILRTEDYGVETEMGGERSRGSSVRHTAGLEEVGGRKLVGKRRDETPLIYEYSVLRTTYPLPLPTLESTETSPIFITSYYTQEHSVQKVGKLKIVQKYF